MQEVLGMSVANYPEGLRVETLTPLPSLQLPLTRALISQSLFHPSDDSRLCPSVGVCVLCVFMYVRGMSKVNHQ